MFSKNLPKFLSIFILLAVILIFGVSVFKNISYPLLWNDEADTVIHGRGILKMGYPRVHDGKNVLDLTPSSDRGLAIKENYDAMIGMPWSQYYFAAAAEIFAQKSSDIYQKTAILRIPFALAGLVGLWLLGSAVSHLIFNGNRRRVFMALYLILSALSISLTLHLRETRYYSLVILFGGLAVWIFGRWYFENKSKFITYFLLSSVSFFLLFNTYVPIYFIFAATIPLYALIDLFIKIKNKQLTFFNFWDLVRQIIVFPEFGFFLKTIAPVCISIFYIVPLINFFEVFHIGNEIAKTQYLDYFANIFHVFGFFGKLEFLYLVIFSEVLAIFFYFSRNAGDREKVKKIFYFSNFLVLFFFVHTLIISRIPFLFERYFIILIPILNLLIVANVFIIYEIISASGEAVWKKKTFYALIFVFILNVGGNHMETLRGHWLEMNNIYKGPLDFAIPYLQEKYPNPENLIIATNYEEYVFMYYLKAKVIVGYVGNNLEEDLQLNPDVIIARKFRENIEALQSLIQKNPYEKVSFDVFDSQVNNIPELDCPIYHLYETRLPRSEKEKLEILLKK